MTGNTFQGKFFDLIDTTAKSFRLFSYGEFSCFSHKTSQTAQNIITNFFKCVFHFDVRSFLAFKEATIFHKVLSVIT